MQMRWLVTDYTKHIRFLVHFRSVSVHTLSNLISRITIFTSGFAIDKRKVVFSFNQLTDYLETVLTGHCDSG